MERRISAGTWMALVAAAGMRAERFAFVRSGTVSAQTDTR